MRESKVQAGKEREGKLKLRIGIPCNVFGEQREARASERETLVWLPMISRLRQSAARKHSYRHHSKPQGAKSSQESINVVTVAVVSVIVAVVVAAGVIGL